MAVKKISECTRIEQLIKNPANRIVEKPLGMGYELYDAAGKLLFHAYDDTVGTRHIMGFQGGIYEADFTRARLTNQWQHYLLFDAIKNQFAMQKFASVRQALASKQRLRRR